jgi:ATP-dependent Clp protease ATP-binding subunit ClpA
MGFLSRQVGVEQIQSDVLREVERRFTPEFRNRLDDVIIFQPLSRDEVRAIASLQIDRLAQQMQASGKTLTVTPPAFDQLVAEGYSLAYGARFLKRTIESRIALPISQRWNDGRVFTARVENGSIEIDVSAAPLAATA